ncbi:GGDEF domain-containing protein [Dongia deserti]|uniref:GGDEF domain-containing protein n=1 Tax=Dongia deserti TaxID=2268030 RepID=UPI0013C51350|nr:GGDEF domain-containing protein [Dongia deserti]
MVISKTDFASSASTRETLVPVVSAIVSAVLAVAMHDTFPVMAGVTGAFAGAAAGVLLLRRSSIADLDLAAPDPREVRLHALETELACERTMHEAFKRDAEAREEELKRFLADLEMTHSALEGQASQSVELAEELAEQKQHSDYLASHDMLTGLPNRLAFQGELKRRVEYAASSGSTIALLFIDLDRFKDVNDTLGHEAGDRLLQQVAGTFGAAMRHDDFAARLGGDEFAVIVEIPPEEAREVAITVAERVRQELQLTVSAPGTDLAIGATIGIALCPQDATSANGLLHAADEVMYVGKRRGRNRVITTDELKQA